MSDAQTFDIIVVGAGVIGSALAMHLAEQGASRVAVIDLDLEGRWSSSELNAGGVRGTWGLPINVLTSKLSIDFFESVADEVGFRSCGYLWLTAADRWEHSQAVAQKQNQLGWPVEEWSTTDLRDRIPFLDKLDGIQGAFFGRRDGLINTNLLKLYFRKCAIEKGVTFLDRTALIRGRQERGQWVLETAVFPKSMGEQDLLGSYLATDVGRAAAQVKGIPVPQQLKATSVVNCAGPWAAQIAERLGYRSPSYPLRRQICLFDCRDVDLTPYGMMIDPSGVYFHPEAQYGLAGFATPGEAPGFNFDYDGESFFMETIWPALFERATAFERLRHLSGWSGLYEVSPDESGIVGPARQEGKDIPGLFEAHSFSGHGVMHSYAVGKGLAELMVGGKFQTIDLSPLSARRFELGEAALLRERWVI